MVLSEGTNKIKKRGYKMYDYEYDKIHDEYQLLECVGWGEYIVLGYAKTERDAYYWYCKKNGYEYDSSVTFN